MHFSMWSTIDVDSDIAILYICDMIILVFFAFPCILGTTFLFWSRRW